MAHAALLSLSQSPFHFGYDLVTLGSLNPLSNLGAMLRDYLRGSGQSWLNLSGSDSTETRMADVLLWRSSRTAKDGARVRASGKSCSNLGLLCKHKGLDALHRTFKNLGVNGTGNADSQCTHVSLVTLGKLVREEIASSHAAETTGILWESVTDRRLEHPLLEEINFV